MWEAVGQQSSQEGTETLVPLTVEGQTVYLSVRSLGPGAGYPAPGEESDISARRPTLEQALDGLMCLARAMGARLQQSGASKAIVQFGCEFALESGTFVAVVGKATAKSTFTVGLEWEKPSS
ncbi:CU044_2847 family protein [Streptomyces sp. Ag109_G2-15]|uniref:CU044_2847 family protein n=1 Tax=Streptomyces sp. Ag109_G2-15 TaxID=1938850 RepID=UPI000BC4BE1E|nr:CU044_2847 family protein [Streptomyces sp. Ag109_G2-15]SOE08029.1 hypothetical protein SAMN06272765_8955 [Streptomyces sp. Ag109_G2-15]